MLSLTHFKQFPASSPLHDRPASFTVVHFVHQVTGSSDGRQEAVPPGPGYDDRVHEAGHQEGEDTWQNDAWMLSRWSLGIHSDENSGS